MKVNTIYFKPSFWAKVGILLGKPIILNFTEKVDYYYGGRNTLEINSQTVQIAKGDKE